MSTVQTVVWADCFWRHERLALLYALLAQDLQQQSCCDLCSKMNEGLNPPR